MEDVSKGRLIAEAKALAIKRGQNFVLRTDFMKDTGISEHYVLKFFDSWTDFWQQAGLEPQANKPLNDEDMLQRAREIFLQEKGILTALRFEKVSGFSRKTYQRRWGTWPSFLAAFREWVTVRDSTFPYLAELDRLIQQPRLEPTVPNGSVPGAKSWTSTGGRRYGPLLNFRGLLHAPVNEQGVVFLFGMVAFELGYIVESVATGFPDCEAKRRVKYGSEAWERVRIEFEYQSRNFLDHGHDPTKCDIIVCWEHNWSECPLEVAELKSLVRELGA
jgi:hypothetical protein